jgi:hypothetical protein
VCLCFFVADYQEKTAIKQARSSGDLMPDWFGLPLKQWLVAVGAVNLMDVVHRPVFLA